MVSVDYSLWMEQALKKVTGSMISVSEDRKSR